MKTIIIPDIHHRIGAAKAILAEEVPDQVIWLGDWFDDFHDNDVMAAHTAEWLSSRMDKHPEDIFTWGNHDLAYGFHSPATNCSGYEEGKMRAIRDIMTTQHWDRFVWYHWADKYLCSHAGLTGYHTEGIKDVPSWLAEQADEASYNVRQSKPHWMYAAGRARWGRAKYGGIVWCDTCEFIPINGVSQIFGHTPQPRPWKYDTNRRNAKFASTSNYCIDTHSRHYAILRGSDIELCCTDDLSYNRAP